MSRRSKFVCGGVTFETSLPTRAWDPEDNTIGGTRVSGAGIPASYIVRRDALLHLMVRFLESEWPDVLALVEAAQSGLPIAWSPDADAVASIQVYLESPAAGERWKPDRDPEYPRAMQQELVLRGVTGTPWMPYFP